MTVIENKFMQEVESIKEIFEKQKEDLKMENGSKLKIIEEKHNDEIYSCKVMTEKIQRDLENLKMQNEQNEVKIKVLESKHAELVTCDKEAKADKAKVNRIDEKDSVEHKTNKSMARDNIKTKKKKAKKAIIEEKLIAAFENDVDRMYTDLDDYGLDL
jgi:hypothetical protein